jgi:hypothetical protein
MAQTLCKTAGGEPKLYLVPIAETMVDPDGMLELTSIVLGTFTKSDGLLDLWIRKDRVAVEFAKDRSGNPVLFNGEQVESGRKTIGKYSLEKWKFDCGRKIAGLYDFVVYEEGKPASSTRIPPHTMQLSSVVPGSVGGETFEAACMLYQ